MKWDDLSQFHIYWESSLIMMLSRVGVLSTCLVMLIWMMTLTSHSNAAQVTAQSQPPSSLYTQQAVTQVQVTEQAAEIARLRASQDTQDARIQALSNDLSNMGGMGKGAIVVIGLLQALQIILQVRGKKPA